MRRLIIFFVVIAVLPAIAWAGTPEVPPKENKVLAGYDGGFILRSADESFKLKFSGLLQPAYKAEKMEETPSQTKNLFDHGFYLEYSFLRLSGTVYNKVDFEGRMFAYTSGSGSNNWMVKANVTYKFNKYLKVQAGQVTMPFSRATSGIFIVSPLPQTQSEKATELTIARDQFGVGSDLGVVFKGGVGKFHYSLGIGNGSGSSRLNANNELAYTARIAYDILAAANSDYDFDYSEMPQLTVGMGVAFEDDDAVDTGSGGKGTNARLDYSVQLCTDIAFRWRGFAITAEGYYKRVRVVDPGTAVVGRDGFLTDLGYYVDASYYIIPKKFAVGARAGQIFREGPDNDAFEFSTGTLVNLVDDRVTWHVEYSYLLDYDEIMGPDDQSSHRIRTKIKISF